MKFRTLIGLGAMLLASCVEEEDKRLRTDIPTEAQQLFSVSKIQNEHLFLALTSWEEFRSLDSASLPGCPEMIMEVESKKVTLNYGKAEACPFPQVRSGTIILDLAKQESLSAEWFMEFESYSYEGDTLQGYKVFQRVSERVVSQSFENLRITSSQNTRFMLSGELVHTRPPTLGSLEDIASTSGKIEGTNPIGREVSMAITAPILSLDSCTFTETNLPNSGTESWIVSRGSGNTVSHTLSYETAGPCQTTAKMQLPDGRVLILNP